METRVLRYFLTIAKLGTVSAAARELHVAQPTLSRQIQQLESRLGVPLFKRESRQMILTKAGEAYQERVKQVLIQLRRANQLAADIGQGTLTGKVGIGCVESNVVSFLSPLLQRFGQKYPQVIFDVYDADGEDIKENLDRHQIELGVVSDPINTAKYNTIRLPIVDEWGVAVRDDRQFAGKTTLAIHDLVGRQLIIPHRSLVKDEISGWLKPTDNHLHIRGEYNLLGNAVALAGQTDAGIICIKGGLAMMANHLHFYPLTPYYKQRNYLIWRKDLPLSEPAQRLLVHLKKVVTK